NNERTAFHRTAPPPPYWLGCCSTLRSAAGGEQRERPVRCTASWAVNRNVLVLLMGPRAGPDRKFSLFPWNAFEILAGLLEEVRSIPRRCAENTRRIDRLITKRVGHPGGMRTTHPAVAVMVSSPS